MKKTAETLIIQVDRSVKPNYPDETKKLVYPEFECTGPEKYDLMRLRQLVHKDRGDGTSSGKPVYKNLKQAEDIKDCLNLQDGQAIRDEGVEVFRKVFGENYVFLWKSIAKNKDGDLRVPFLFAGFDSVMIDWRWVGRKWYRFYLTPAFPTN